MATVCLDMATNMPIEPERPVQYVVNARCGDIPDDDCSARQGCRGCPADRDDNTPDPTPLTGYPALGVEIGRLVEGKQAAYGDSFGKSGDVMRTLFPAGIPADRLGDALAIVRVLDKLFRIATDRDAMGESPWRDIAGYALLAIERQERERRVN